MGTTGPTDETALGRAASDTRRATPISHSGWLSSPSPGDGRFDSGTVLGDRYRIIGLLGRGGMGEVYRADDLRLGQPVALKFLPQQVTGEAVRLAQFHNEVRTARQVSHRNVCRVYDIGEAGGRIFPTMEFVDGEDLASLLKRIGRFPSDRAIEIARQVCAGLAAAHEQGVLHRDLKPANVMIDRDGRVRITDFGLAGLATEITDIRAGTPAYMAPEQLAGREVSVRSDLFALGLVLFEIFTGKRAFDAKNVAELLRMHDEPLALTPTSAVRDLDPAIERVILRCLEREPARRPASAIAVSAALPGGDPLAAALAAGETPSPEMVANAGQREAIAPAYGLSAITVIIAGLVALMYASYETSIVHRVPFDLAPMLLADRARTILEGLGYHGPPVDVFGGFEYNSAYPRWVVRTRRGVDRWRELGAAGVPTATYWYRTSPEPLVPEPDEHRTDMDDPPMALSGMTQVVVDTRGRLLYFRAVPPFREADAGAGSATAAAGVAATPPPDWSTLFAAANLPMDRFTPATPVWNPPDHSDHRAAWTGTLPEADDLAIRIEAAGYKGRVTLFRIIYPWTPHRDDPAPEAGAGAASGTATPLLPRVTTWISDSLYQIVFLVAIVMARHNVRLRRGDRHAAFWVATIAFAFSLAQWFIDARYLFTEDRIYFAAALALLEGARMGIFYLALEPIVRRYWPFGMISWSRLIAGDWRDPLVGWHVLAGVACGVVLHVMLAAYRLLPAVMGDGPPMPDSGGFGFLDNLGVFLGTLPMTVTRGLGTALFVVFCYAIGRRLLRRDLYASAAVGLFLALALAKEFITGRHLPVEIGMLILLAAMLVVILRWFGLVAALSMFMVNQLFQFTPLTANMSDWYAYTTVSTLVIIGTLTLYGYVTSRAGEPVFGRLISDPAEA